jgi:uncharacterized protein (TIGR03382 family)
MRNTRLATTLATALLGYANLAGAQAPLPAPFTLVGYIDAIELDDPADPLSGGTITANGIRVVIPRNTIVKMPASWLSMTDLFATAPLPYGLAGNGQSGLAHGDTPPPLASYEVQILGNQVGPLYVAGLVSISQELFNLSQVTINCIDHARGDLRVGGAAGDCGSGARVRLADPAGRHGRTSSHDARFTSDSENPNIRSITGYPMCLPRTDPAIGPDALCPQSNRPSALGAFLTRWTMGLTAGTDATQQAPFEVGDQVSVSGTLAEDDLGVYTEAWSVVANLGIETRPGVDPAYVVVDELIFGTGGTPIPGILQDAVLSMVALGYTTDPSRLVDAYAIDTDPVTGAEGARLIATMNPAAQIIPNFYATEALTSDYLPLSREVRVRIRGATSTISANGFRNATYRAPVDEYVFPVNLRAGDPLVPMNFEDFPFLACGSGPRNGGPVVGQLAPFPYSPVPDPGGCVLPPPDVNPIADAGADLTVASGAIGTLDASRSADPEGGTLTYNWTQISGPAVLLSNANVASPTFDAPALPAGAPSETLVFRLFVTNASGSAADTVAVTVTAPAGPQAPVDPGSPSSPGGGGCGTAPGATSPAALLALSMLLRRRSPRVNRE